MCRWRCHLDSPFCTMPEHETIGATGQRKSDVSTKTEPLIGFFKPKNPRRRIKFYLRKLYHRGSSCQCPFCHSRIRKFLPFGKPFPVLQEKQVVGAGLRANCRCPACHSLDRERLLLLFLQNNPDLLESLTRLLHVAPERKLRNILEKQKHIDYVTADVDPKKVSTKIR